MSLIQPKTCDCLAVAFVSNLGKVSSHNQPMPCHCNKALIASSCHLCNYVKPYPLSSGAYPIRAAYHLAAHTHACTNHYWKLNTTFAYVIIKIVSGSNSTFLLQLTFYFLPLHHLVLEISYLMFFNYNVLSPLIELCFASMMMITS
ncbi:hypothetical protein VNO80_08135 [Phaseolus coccineus]|uniref:Uncharacterized protein n=1 Tax=Phaseolus coccineus TaxID=3886 RepID=A0AAN9NQ06_PHACN